MYSIFRWPQHLLCSAEHFCTHHYVLLLHGCCYGTQIQELDLVEEICHLNPDGNNTIPVTYAFNLLFNNNHCSPFLLLVININFPLFNCYRFSLWWSWAISSNCYSLIAITRRASWFGLVSMVCCSSSSSQTSTKPITVPKRSLPKMEEPAWWGTFLILFFLNFVFWCTMVTLVRYS